MINFCIFKNNTNPIFPSLPKKKKKMFLTFPTYKVHISIIEINNMLNVIIIPQSKYKVECRATESESRIRCHGGESSLC
jgi:hypothetical protein